MEVTSYRPGSPSWVDIGCTGHEEAMAFYGGLFGWEFESQGPEVGDYHLITLRGKPIGGLGVQEGSDSVPYWTTYISVDNAEITSKAVAEAGGTVFVDAMDIPGQGRMAVFVDSTGAPFSAWEPLQHIGASLINEPGAMCWVELTTRDVEEAKSFYWQVFGWEAVERPMGALPYVEWWSSDRMVGGMMPMDDGWPASIGSHWMVYFAVEDTDAAVSRVHHLGGDVVVPPTDIPPGRFAVVTDPHGAVFSIIEQKPMADSMRSIEREAV